MLKAAYCKCVHSHAYCLTLIPMQVFDADAEAPSSSSSSGKAGKVKNGADGSCSSSADADGRQRSWQGSLVFNRAKGGHTRPATAVAFLSAASSSDLAGTSSSKQQGAGHTPSHLLSGSEDRRLLLWELPQLGVQGKGTEWVSHADEHESGERSAESKSLVAHADHGRKINCVHVMHSGDAEQAPLAFVGDTSRKLSCYHCEVS